MSQSFLVRLLQYTWIYPFWQSGHQRTLIPCTWRTYLPTQMCVSTCSGRSFFFSFFWSLCCLFQMQQQELAQMRQRDANLTALAAIGPRKKRKVDSPGATPSGTEVRLLQLHVLTSYLSYTLKSPLTFDGNLPIYQSTSFSSWCRPVTDLTRLACTVSCSICTDIKCFLGYYNPEKDAKADFQWLHFKLSLLFQCILDGKVYCSTVKYLASVRYLCHMRLRTKH